MILYLAGKYSGDVKKNVEDAQKIAAKLWDMGFAVICPHTNSAYFEEVCQVAQYDSFVKGYMEILSVCDAMVLLPGWETSTGANMEKRYADKYGIEVFEYPNLPQVVENKFIGHYLKQNEGWLFHE